MFPVDFSKGEEIYPDIAEELKDLDIGILGIICAIASKVRCIISSQ